tara:strand:+ start:877 stop:1050 length:174 start_codon:yes stop_codon:yes gene_type:complete
MKDKTQRENTPKFELFQVPDPSIILYVGGYFYFFIKQVFIFILKKFLLITKRGINNE